MSNNENGTIIGEGGLENVYRTKEMLFESDFLGHARCRNNTDFIARASKKTSSYDVVAKLTRKLS